MKIEDTAVYSVTKDIESYLKEVNGGIIEDKGLELIMRLKMTDGILIENMYKVQAFNNLEETYKRIGGDMFSNPKYTERIQQLFHHMFNY